MAADKTREMAQLLVVRRRAMMGLVAGLAAALASSVGLGLGLSRIGAVNGRLKTVEHETTIIERKIVTLPCTHGNDSQCRAFLAVLLSRTTAQQLERLLQAKKIVLTPAKIKALERLFAHPRKRRHHRRHRATRRKGVMPGKEKEKPSPPGRR